MQPTLNSPAFKILSLLFGFFSLILAGAVLAYTNYTIESHSWQEEGSIRMLIMGLSLAAVFILYAVLSFKAFRESNIKNILVIYAFQACLFFGLTVLVCLAVYFSIM
jgi:hypothetical protein